MRRAELLMALMLGVFSAYLMYKSAELPIGWIPEEGPGGGAFPFWLSAGMLVCCGWIVLRWLLRVSLPARSDEPYLATGARGMILRVVLALTLMIGAIHVIGMYFSIPVFLLYYVRMIGRHGWPVSLAVSLSTPVVGFLFFEIALRITLPKGYTEPLFYPLYDIFL
jgi:hypothetical protein